MKNPHDDPRLTAYALGELSESERAAVEAWLAASPEHRQELEEVRDLAAVLKSALAREAEAAVDPSLPAAVEAELVRLESAATTPDIEPANVVRPFMDSRFAGACIVIAAVLVALVAGCWMWATRPGSDKAFRLAQGGEMTSTAGDVGSTPAALSNEPPASAAPPPGSPSLPPAVASSQTDPTAMSPVDPRDPAAMPDTVPLAESREALVRQGGPASPRAAAGGLNAETQATSGGDPTTEAPPSTLPPDLLRRYGLASPNDLPARAQESLNNPPPAPVPTRIAQQPEVLLRGRSLSERAGPEILALGAESGSSDRWAAQTAGSSQGLVEMSPELRSRYGLEPSGIRPSARSSEPESRYGIGPAPGRHPGEPRLVPEPEWSYRGGRHGPDDENPAYVDVGINLFEEALKKPLSTFSLDVDTGSYANVRRFLNAGRLPPPAAVRLEEMLNYFTYSYPEPAEDEVFGVKVDIASCPWEPRHRLVRIAIKAREPDGPRPGGNLVFLVDVSGSMSPRERLPLLKEALSSLVKRLATVDRVAIVTYAREVAVHLESTSCEEKAKILEAIDSLIAGGSTYGEGGIRQAYDVATRNFIPGGVNRVFLCTDGDFNVGIRNQNELVELIREKARSGVFLTTLGVGTDNYKDALMRRLADEGNGTYHYLDSFEEARRVLVEQMNATFVTVARDAKAQVEFNPGKVTAWRLLGYEKRLMAPQDFNNDARDAGEIGAGHSVTVLYEIVPEGVSLPAEVGPLKYQRPPEPPAARPTIVPSDELLTVKLRYQRPEGSRSSLMEIAVTDDGRDFRRAGPDFKFAAAVAAFAMALREPNHDNARLDLALDLARQGLGEDPGGWRAEFITLVRKARELIDRGREPRASPGFQ